MEVDKSIALLFDSAACSADVKHQAITNEAINALKHHFSDPTNAGTPNEPGCILCQSSNPAPHSKPTANGAIDGHPHFQHTTTIWNHH